MSERLITEVVTDSIADELEIEAGDFLLSVNNKNVADVFDYKYLIQDERVELSVRKKSGEKLIYEIEKDGLEDIGLEFGSYLMDNVRRCGNACVFCFIDQLPRGLRPSLYFKDDDPRLSFLHGNYATLTNAGPRELRRLISHRLSPVNISVHTTDPALRSFMLGNKKAGRIMEQIREIAGAGLTMNFQAVVCKSLNDGEILDKTIGDLSAFHPYGKSLSVVPAGLTRHRAGLFDIEPFTEDGAGEIIRVVEKWQRKLKRKIKTGFVFAADEFYIKAATPMPRYNSYEDFPQLENGVGMAALFEREVVTTLKKARYNGGARSVDVATGTAAYSLMRSAADKITEKFPLIDIRVHEIENRFFGESVTVSGLLTGRDMIDSLNGKLSGEFLLIPKNVLRADTETLLDDVETADISERLNIKTIPCETDGERFIKKILL